jgi:precorrin-3B methylase
MTNVGGPYSYGCSPADLRIESNLAVIPAGPGQEGEMKRRVEIWIDRANQIYAEDMKREAAERERGEKRALKKEQEAQEYRARVLRQLNP